MEVGRLASCVVEFITLMLELYNKNKISYEDLIDNTRLKYNFLKEYVNEIKNLEVKAAAFDIIKRYEKISAIR